MSRLVSLVARILLIAGGFVAVLCGLVAVCLSFSPTISESDRSIAVALSVAVLSIGALAIFAGVWWSGWEE
jgi:hypothetical protein